MMPSIPQLLIVLVIVVLLFGAKRLRNLGGDLGGAVKGFKKAMTDDEEKEQDQAKLEEAGEETEAASVAKESSENKA